MSPALTPTPIPTIGAVAPSPPSRLSPPLRALALAAAMVLGPVLPGLAQTAAPIPVQFPAEPPDPPPPGGARVEEGRAPTDADPTAPRPQGEDVPPGGGQVVVIPESPAEAEALQDEAPGADAADEGPAEEVVAALSHNQVSITTTYSGSEIFVFGAVKRLRATGGPPIKPEVIVTISGPSGPIAVRRKERVLGVWVNRDISIIDHAPSFYAIASTGPLDEILSATENLRYKVGLDEQVRSVGAASEVEDPEAFMQALVRLQKRKGLYVTAPIPVNVIEDTLFATHVALPANIVEGDYLARVFLVHDRKVIDLHESVVGVRKVGLERWIYALSREDPLAYGLLALGVALACGWGASEAFRLMRG